MIQAFPFPSPPSPPPLFSTSVKLRCLTMSALNEFLLLNADSSSGCAQTDMEGFYLGGSSILTLNWRMCCWMDIQQKLMQLLIGCWFNCQIGSVQRVLAAAQRLSRNYPAPCWTPRLCVRTDDRVLVVLVEAMLRVWKCSGPFTTSSSGSPNWTAGKHRHQSTWLF